MASSECCGPRIYKLETFKDPKIRGLVSLNSESRTITVQPHSLDTTSDTEFNVVVSLKDYPEVKVIQTFKLDLTESA